MQGKGLLDKLEGNSSGAKVIQAIKYKFVKCFSQIHIRYMGTQVH